MLHLKVIFPNWILKWSPLKVMRETFVAFEELQVSVPHIYGSHPRLMLLLKRYMEDMIRSGRSSEKKEDRFDLFSSLLDANVEEVDGQSNLSDSELMGMLVTF